MARIKRGVTSHARHKKVLKQVKGQYGRRKNTIRVAKQALEKAMQYAYRDRRAKKREFRSLWIQRINAGVRAEGITYSKFKLFTTFLFIRQKSPAFFGTSISLSFE